MVDLYRLCSKCDKIKHQSWFPKRERGLQCKACLAAAKQEWNKNNPDKVILARQSTNKWHRQNRDKVYDNISRYRYGVTVAEVDAMIAKQNNRCAICKQLSSRRLCLDHCHDTGKIRGIICHDCNLALGRVKDNVDVLRSMIEYLEING